MDIIYIVVDIIAVLVVSTIHELSKAVVSVKLGDNTPKYNGKFNLNPLKYVDPIGLLLLITIRVGWSKPVETNVSNYKNRKKGTVMVALTGILTSLIFAFILTIIYHLIFNNLIGNEIQTIIKYFISSCAIYSVTIAVFNLIPVSPFAMSKILSVYYPRFYFKMIQYETLILVILLMVIFFGGASYVFVPIVNTIVKGFDILASLIII